MRTRLQVVFKGRVQGVFFRVNTKRFADRYGVVGWVRNTESGDVEALFEGEDDAVNAVMHDCQNSQPYARVEQIERTEKDPLDEFKDFRIRY
jgi:acylphosphatase